MIFFVLRDIHYYVPNEYVKSDLYFIAMIPVVRFIFNFF